MGTRAQVKVIQDPTTPDIFLYQHWDGNGLAEKVQRALRLKSGRWDDPTYLTRIIFREMIRGFEDEFTGYGIGTQIQGDIEYLVTVNIPKQRIKVEHVRFSGPNETLMDSTFQEFTEAEIPKS